MFCHRQNIAFFCHGPFGEVMGTFFSFTTNILQIMGKKHWKIVLRVDRHSEFEIT